MNKYLEHLEKTGMSLIIYRNGEIIFSSDKKGIRPHLIAIERLGREALQGTVMVDKIIGRAAALLIMYSGASEVHAALISTGGKEIFQNMGVVFTFNEETDAIKVKKGKIFCPFEKMVQDITDPEEAYRKIIAKMKEISAF